MSNRFPAVAALIFAIPLTAAAEGTGSEVAAATAPVEPAPPDWSISIGAGALAVPSYPGSASSMVMPVPFLDIRYRDRFFLSPVAGIGVNAVSTQRMQIGVSVLPDFGRSDSADRLRGWGSISGGANAKVFGAYSIGPVGLLADVRRQLGAGNGLLIDAGVTRAFVLSRHLIVIPTATLTWADARYMRTYFGVDGNQSAAASSQGLTVPTHSAGFGPRDAALTLVAIVPLDERWSVQSLVRAEFLLGDAAASPVTERRFQPTFGGFLAYHL